MPIITDFYKKKNYLLDFPAPWEKVLILSISCPQQNTLLYPIMGLLTTKEIKVGKNKKWGRVCIFSLFCVIRFKYQFGSKVLQPKRLSP